jgi:hypothetical protein
VGRGCSGWITVALVLMSLRVTADRLAAVTWSATLCRRVFRAWRDRYRSRKRRRLELLWQVS